MAGKQVGLIELPEIGDAGILFTLKNIIYSPKLPRMDEPFNVKGEIELLGLPFLAPAWVIAYVTYPETFWEEIIPIWGSPRVSESTLAIGGKFEMSFPTGFQREGKFGLRVEMHAGPTMPIDTFTIPPFPPLAKEEATFTVSGKAPPEAERIKEFRIISYAKNGGTPVVPPKVLELEVEDKCRVKVGGSHKDGAIGGTLRVALWEWSWFDPHNERLFATKPNAIPASTDWQPFETTLDIAITSAVTPGAEYGLYAKISGITGADIYSPYYEKVIRIVGVPAKGKVSNLDISYFAREAPIGGTCKVTVVFDYEGPTATKTIRAAIGHQIYGVAARFDEKVYAEKKITLAASEIRLPYKFDLEILITEGKIKPAESPFDIYAKIDGLIPEAQSPLYEDVITIIEAPLKGSITGKWINKAPEGNRIPIPTQVTADGNIFEVGVKYKNYSGRTITAGCKVQVWDPDGILRASPAIDWTGMSHNEELSTQYNICRVDKTGDWKIRIEFLMNPDNPVVVNYYDGLVFTAVSEKYAGSITGKWINKAPEGNRIPIPTQVTADGNTFEVGVKYKNYSGRTVIAGCKVKVWDPDGILRASPAIDWTGMSHNEELSTQYNICRVDKAGDWKIRIEFLMNRDNPVVVNYYDGLVFKAVEKEVPPPTKEEFTNLIVTSYTKTVKVGAICRVETSFNYKGPKTERGLYAAIGHQYYGLLARFEEKVAGSIRMAVPETITTTKYYCGVDVPVTEAKIKPAESPFDLRAKITDGLFPRAESPIYNDVITVLEKVPGGITFQVGVTGTPLGWSGYDRWMVAYFDPGISAFVGDQKWHFIYEYVIFSDVLTGGYFAAWVLRSSDPSVHSPQYTSSGLWLADGKKYLFNLENLVVYQVA